MKLLMTLYNKNISIHLVNMREVKNFIHSFGNSVRTDKLEVLKHQYYAGLSVKINFSYLSLKLVMILIFIVQQYVEEI